MAAQEFDSFCEDEEQVAAWDAVLTCFYIDSCPNIILACKNIHRVLRDGGLWINQGAVTRISC